MMEPVKSPQVRLSFFARWSQPFQRFFGWLPLTREGWLWFLMALGLLLTGLTKSINLLTLLACMLLGLLVLNWCWARRQVRRVKVERFQAEPFFAQSPTTWMWRIWNEDRLPIQGVRLEEQFAKITCQWFIVLLPSRESRWATITVAFPDRGVQTSSGLHVRTGYPFGLVRVDHLAAAATEVLVFPRLGTVHRGQIRKILHQSGPAMERIKGSSAPYPAAQTEFHGLRMYRPGDSPRLIHWKTSARKNRLMVREFEDPPTDHLIVVALAERGVNLESVLSWTSSVVWEWCRQKGDHLCLVLAGKTVLSIEGTTSRDLALEMLDTLAREPGSLAFREDELANVFESRRMPPGPILVITGETSAATLVRNSWGRPASELSVKSEKDSLLFDFSKLP